MSRSPIARWSVGAVGRVVNGWGGVFLAAAAAFLVFAMMAVIFGIADLERQLYERINGALHPTSAPVFHRITQFGSNSTLLPAYLLLILALPNPLLRRWWLWIVAMVVSSTLEGEMKQLIGRPRPSGLNPGFPSGHTAAIATFSTLAVYLACHALRDGWQRITIVTTAAAAIGAVGLSRIVLQKHWPLDVAGGAALGVMCAAAAAWWNQRYPPALPYRPRAAWRSLQTSVYRWRAALCPLLVAVVFLTAPVVSEDSQLEALFDITGSILVVAGLILRGWAAGARAAATRLEGAGALVAIGPYRIIRHPVHAANSLILLGIVVLAESAGGLVIVPAALFGAYRIIVNAEEELLKNEFGARYSEYSQLVPRWVSCRVPRKCLSDPCDWSALKREWHVAAGAAVVGMLTELTESLPHLFG
jgi:undecaprenyl-diphosphatase